MLSIRRLLVRTATTRIEIYPPTAVICNRCKLNNFGNKIPYPIVPCLIYHPLLQRSESRFLSFNAWLVDGKIQIESNLPLVTYSADSPHSYRIHSMVQRIPMKSKTFYKINSSHSEIYLFVWMLKSPLHTTVFEIKM